MELTNQQLQQLYDYVITFPHVDNIEELFEVVDYQHLRKLLDTDDESAIQLNLELVYEQHKVAAFTAPVFYDEEIENVMLLVPGPENPFAKEIDVLIGGLNLQKFDLGGHKSKIDFSNDSHYSHYHSNYSHHNSNYHSHATNLNSSRLDNDNGADWDPRVAHMTKENTANTPNTANTNTVNTNTVNTNTVNTNTVNTSSSKNHSIDQRLAKTKDSGEPRDLRKSTNTNTDANSNSNADANINSNTARISTKSSNNDADRSTKSSTSRTYPFVASGSAATEISNVNVLTKAQIQPLKKPTSIVQKFNFITGRKRQDKGSISVGTGITKNSVNHDNTSNINSNSNSNSNSDANTNNNINNNSDADTHNNSNNKNNNKNSTNKVDRPPGREARTNRRTSMVEDQLPMYIRKQLQEAATANLLAVNNSPRLQASSSRVKSIVSNSNSLYAATTDNSREPSQGSTSEVSTERNFSEDDREYILPTLISRYLDYEEDDLADIDFVNLSAGEEDDEEDAYLFK